MWSLRLEFRCKIRVHTRGLVPEASAWDKFPATSPLVCADLKGSIFTVSFTKERALLWARTCLHCVKAKIFLSILDSNMSLWRYTILEYSRRTRHVTYTWNIPIEYGGIRAVHNRSWIFVKVYNTSVVLLEYDDKPFVKKLWKKVTVQVHSKI